MHVAFCYYPEHNSPMRASVNQTTANLTSTCPQRGMNDYPASIEMTCYRYVGSSAHVGLLEWNYRYTEIATQIPHDTGWHWRKIHPSSGIGPTARVQSCKLHVGTDVVFTLIVLGYFVFDETISYLKHGVRRQSPLNYNINTISHMTSKQNNPIQV